MNRKKLHTMVDEIADGIDKATSVLETTFADTMGTIKKHTPIKTSSPNKFQLGQMVSSTNEGFDEAQEKTICVVICIKLTQTKKILYNLVDDYSTVVKNVEEDQITIV